MNESDRFNRPALCHFIKKQTELMLGHATEGLIFERVDVRPGFGAADDSQKINDCAHSRGHVPARKKSSLIDRFGYYLQICFHSVSRLAFLSAALHWREQR